MIWLIGGTSDALKIAETILKHNRKCLITTTTDYGAQLANMNGVQVIKKRLTQEGMAAFINKYKIAHIVDASHPYASEVSLNAIAVAKEKGIEYYRFERETYPLKNAIYYKTYNELSESLIQKKGNILLTIGSKNVSHFSELKNRLIVRVLPMEESIRSCIDAKIPLHNILALKGIVSQKLNEQLMDEFNIKHLVTKDTGVAGGFTSKTNAALKLGVKIHVLSKPKIDYPNCFSGIDEFNMLIKTQF